MGAPRLALLTLCLLSAPAAALAQDVWTSPAPGVRALRRTQRGRTVNLVTADLRDPQLRPSVRALGAEVMSPVAAAEASDAFVALALRDQPEVLDAVRAMLGASELTRPARLIDDAPGDLWGAVGLTAARRLVLVTSDRTAMTPGSLEESLRSAGVVRAVAVRGARAPSLLLGGRGVSGAGSLADAVVGVRLLPGASHVAGEARGIDLAADAKVGAPVTVTLRALNTGRAPWRAGDAPQGLVVIDGVATRLSLEGEARPGELARFTATWTPARAGAHTMRASVSLEDGTALGPEVLRVVRVRTPTRLPPPARRVETAGVSLLGGGPSGVAWLALSVFGSVSAALTRRARRDE
ncbi:MAG: hypothetical protein R3A48_06440 [Polyangiales bacterium]